MRTVLALALGIGGGFAVADDAPTADERAAIDAVVKLKGKAVIDPALPADARVKATFDTATDATLAALAKQPRVGSVQAFDGTKCTEKGLAALRGLPQLRRLVLNKSGVTDAELAAVAGCPQLRELVIPESKVTDAGLAVLSKLPRLVALDLSDNPKVTDKGITHITKLERLEVLHLNKTGITDKGLFELKPLEGLRALSVAGTKVTAAAAEKFPDEMPNLRVVRR